MKSPSDLGLPFPSWRPGQQLAIRTALTAKTSFVAIPAPTGSGKSTIATGLVKMDPRRTVILTGTKQLQTQYAQTFPFLFDIRGMANYECIAAKDEFKSLLLVKQDRKVMCDDGPCRSDVSCTLKDAGCLYFDRYRSALAAPAVLTSYAYWLSMRRFGKGLGVANRLICDEAHAIPEQLAQAWRIEIPHRHVKGQAPRSVEGWRQWAAKELESLKPDSGDAMHRMRRRRDQERFQQLYNFLDTGWVWEQGADAWVFEPVQVAPLASSLWDRQQQIVFLSATLTTAMFQFLGISPDQITLQALKSTFPDERRPVYVLTQDGVRLDAKSASKDGVLDKWIDTIDRIIDGRPGRKGIIHSVSYARATWIMEHSRHADRMTGDLNRFLNEPIGARQADVLVHPAVTTGVDFPYRACEYQIIAKLPFPDTRSKIMKARIDAIPNYREAITMQTIVQASGRGMRADDDQCETFIIDTHAMWFLNQAADFAPRWWLDSVRFERRIPAPPKPLR